MTSRVCYQKWLCRCVFVLFDVDELAEEGGGSAVGNFDVAVLTRYGILSVEDDDFVLAVAPEELFVGAVRGTFDENLIGASHFLLVVFECYLALNGNNFFKASCLFIVGDIVLHVARREGVGAHGVFEHISVVVAYAAEHLECGLMVFLGFGAETSNDIGCYGAVRQVAVYGIDAVEIPLGGVVAIHKFKHTVGTALYGEMDAAADVGVGSHNLQQLIGEVFRV